MPIPKALVNYFKKNKLAVTAVTHKTVFTAYDVAQTLHVPLKDVVKTLVVKGDGKLLLAVLPAERRLDVKKAQKAAKVKALSLVGEKQMEKGLSVQAGAMTAFGGFHNLPVLLDSSLKSKPKPVFGAGSFTDSVRLSMPRYVAVEKPTIAPISETRKATKPKKRSKKGK